MSYYWTKSENEYLAKLVKRYYAKDAARIFQAEAKKNDWPKRTDTAVLVRIRNNPAHKRRVPNWTKAEEEALLRIFQKDQPKEAAKKYRDHARYRKWPKRTRHAILEKVYRMTGTRNLNEENYRVSEFARVLKLPVMRVHTWAKKGQLKIERVGKATKVTEEGILDFAKKYPHRLAEADYSALLYFLGVEMAKEIKEKYPPRKKSKILHLPTGRVYPTIKAAARATHCSYAAVRWHLTKAKPTQFCYLEAV